MARLNIDTGTEGNSATGDTLRTAMTKINTNFIDLYGTHADTGLITTSLTNGDIRIQANGSGIIEVDTVQINNSTISSITTNSNLTLSANGTGAVSIDTIKVLIPNLPTSDPSVAGQVWRSSNDLKISTG